MLRANSPPFVCAIEIVAAFCPWFFCADAANAQTLTAWQGRGPSAAAVHCLAGDPHSAGVLYACITYEVAPDARRNALHKTTDGGASWWASDTGLALPDGFEGSLVDVVVDPATSSTVYALIRMPVLERSGMYRSLDGGQTWAQTSIHGIVPRDIAIDPNQPSTIYVVGNGVLYKTTDGGLSATRLPMPGSGGGTITSVLVTGGTIGLRVFITLENNPHMYRSSDGRAWGISQSLSGGSWERLLAYAPSAPNTMYALTRTAFGVENELFRTTDGGLSWFVVVGSKDDHRVQLAVHPANPAFWYYRSPSEGVLKTTTSGSIMTPVLSALAAQPPIASDLPSQVVFDSRLIDHMYVGTSGGVLKSVDSGASWRYVNGGFPPARVTEVATDPSNPRVLFAATHSSGLFKTTDGGMSWSSTSLITRIQSVSLARTNPSVIAAIETLTEDHDSGVPGAAVVARSIDGGGTWTRVGPIAGFRTYRDWVAISPADHTVMFRGIRVIRMLDSGAAWHSHVPEVLGGGIVFDPVDPRTAYIGSIDYEPPYKTTDGGLSFSPVYLPGFGVAIDPSNHQTLYSWAFREMYKTVDGGKVWIAIPLGGITALSVHPSDSARVIAGTPGGTWRSTTGGLSWRPALAPPPSATRASAVNDVETTLDGQMLAATDAGLFTSSMASALSFGSFGGELFVNVETTGSWSATVSAPWLSIFTGPAGIGDGTVGLRVRPMRDQETRTGHLSIGGRVLTIVQEAASTPLPAPAISLDKTALVFTAISSGAGFASQTSTQAVRLGQPGVPSVAWTAISSHPWLIVSPASGIGTGTLNISVQSVAGLAASQSGTITITATGAANTVRPISVTLTVTGTAVVSPPFGIFDTPAGDATILAGSIAVTGWALDNVGVQRVELWRDLQPGETTPAFSSTPSDPRNGKVFISTATFVDGARPDVEGLHPTIPFNYRAGWGYLLLTWGLWGQGNGTYRLHAFAFDQESNFATLGSKTIVVNNAAATRPFGSIDTPAIGGEASGPNFGWALTPKVNGVATCKIQPSGVQVSIDSGPLQPVVYGDGRGDIAGAFSGFSNTVAAGGHYIADWSLLSNGPHTIGWLITDDCNRADGVGSRFFNVTGGTNLTAAVSAVASGPAAARTVAAPEHESSEPITVARGYGQLPEIVTPGEAGNRTVEVQQGDRINIRLPQGFESAYQVVNGGQRRALPTGSTWDAASRTLSWEPAAGFLGRYRIVFSNGTGRISVRVVVKP